MSDAPVLVTGASGYVGLHVVRRLLRDGHAVRGTVREFDRVSELTAVLAAEDDVSRLRFHRADLTEDDGWASAVAGCRYVVHTASPISLRAPEDPEEMIGPARDGTLRVLRASRAAGVERVVLTSSVAAVSGDDRRPAEPIDESDWTDIEAPAVGAYVKSKTLAERAAWEDLEVHGGVGPELVSINPSLVLGPSIARDHSPSVELVRRLMAREMPGCPRLGWWLVDVRDVADAHVAALTVPEAAGRRFICATGFAWVIDVALILATHLIEHGYRVPTRQLPDWVVRLIGRFDPSVRAMVPSLGRRIEFDTCAIRETLAWQPRPLAQTIRDTADSLAAYGTV